MLARWKKPFNGVALGMLELAREREIAMELVGKGNIFSSYIFLPFSLSRIVSDNNLVSGGISSGMYWTLASISFNTSWMQSFTIEERNLVQYKIAQECLTLVSLSSVQQTTGVGGIEFVRFGDGYHDNSQWPLNLSLAIMRKGHIR